ncbi:MAG: glycosyltransferase 87 family protein, partial [Candidatus Limnocylindria bacterium]
MRRSDLVAYLAGLAAGATVLVLFGFVERLGSNVQTNDLAGFWAGPRALLDGVDPYDAETWQATIARLGTQTTPDPVYGYPPWMLIALVPVALLPLGLATVLWTVVGVSVAVAGTWSLLRSVAPGWPLLHALSGATLLGSQPAIVSFYSGQWTFLLLGATAFMTVLFLRARYARAGM